MDNGLIKVMVVEQSPVIVDVLVDALNSDPGILVQGVAGNCELAVRLFTATRPDVVVIDLRVCNAGGFESLRQLRVTHPCAVVIVSADWKYISQEDRDEVLKGGDYVSLRMPVGAGAKEVRAFGARLREVVCQLGRPDIPLPH